MIGDSFDFFRDVADYVKAQLPDYSNKLARIDYDFDPTGFPGTLPRVIFDGESTVSTKRYQVMGGYYPLPGDRVVMLRVSNTYVIAGTSSPGGVVYSENVPHFTPKQSDVGAAETTTSSSFGDLATYGPEVTVRTGTTALIIVHARVSNTDGRTSAMGWECSGATSISAAGGRSWRPTSTAFFRGGAAHLEQYLNPGVNTFTAKYQRDSSGTTTFADRTLIVIPY